jgi:hypothetical protein
MPSLAVWKHRYGLFLLAVLGAATAATLLTGTPADLPDVALGSSLMLHVERVAAILAVAFFVFVVTVRAWKGQLPTKVSKDGFEYVDPAVLDDAEEAAQQMPTAEQDQDETQETPDSVVELRLKLEEKLSYIAKFMLSDEDCCVTFLTIGSMKSDGYITEQEAHTLIQVMTLRDEELKTLPEGERVRLLHNAHTVVKNIRASVFYGLVWEVFKANKWEIEPIPTRRKRPDLHVVKGDEKYRIVPRFAMAKSSSILPKELRRLKKYAGEKSKRGRTLVVVPDRSDSPLDPEGDPGVIRLGELKKTLGLKRDPRSTA